MTEHERHEEFLRKHCSHLSEEEIAEELKLMASMEAAKDVAVYTCRCGRKHYVEYVPPPHEYYPTSSICACGHEVVFGE